MNWFNLAMDGVLIYAVVEAIAAARRVHNKQQHLLLKDSSVYQPQSSQALSSASSPEPKPLEPARSEPNASEPDVHIELQDSQTGVAELGMPSVPDLELPLAVSLSVSDVMQGTEAGLVTSSIELDLVPPELEIPDIEVSTHSQPSAEHHSVLAEIAELGQSASTDALTQLRPYLDHSDHVIRAATVFELGELAAKRQGAEAAEIAELLMQLGQDPDAQVREQALVAWAKAQSIIAP